MTDRASQLWYDFNFCCSYISYTLLLSYRSEGSRHMPRSGPVLVICNHESYLDPLAAGLAVRRRVWFLARKSLFRPAWFGEYLESTGCVPVDQDGVAKEGLRASIGVLEAGKALLVFPEGTRTEDGNMVPFKPGIALLMRKVPVPIVPVGVAGAYESWPLHHKLPKLSPAFWPWTGGAVAASVGEPILPATYQEMQREEMLAMLERRVAEQIRRAEKLIRKP